MRLDAYLSEKNFFPSRTKAAEAIVKNYVKVNGKIIAKPSFDVEGESVVEVIKDNDFVSNGGYKLEKAFNDFAFSVENLVMADVGASTGGFTDCLLKHGARKVFALDVGESQLANNLKTNDKVVVMDNFNARNITDKTFGERLDGIVCDVSFISLTYVLKPFYDALDSNGFAVVLLKPQFECGKKELNKNGIVTSVKAREECALKIKEFAFSVGFIPAGFTVAPVRAGKNVEYLFLLKKNDGLIVSDENIRTAIKNNA